MGDEEPWTPLTVQEARNLGWRPNSDSRGTVTQACDEWLLVSNDQRAYLHLTLSRMRQVFEAEWEDVMNTPPTDDSTDPYYVFYNRVGMSPSDWEWMTLAAMVRDAVSAYEVYVVNAYQEVQRTHGHEVTSSTPAPRFWLAREGAEILGLDVRPPAVHDVFELRNVLTHQRGELRTEDDRKRHGGEDDLLSDTAHLTEDKVIAALDVLAAAVNDLDPIMWAYTWGQQVAPPLVAPEKGAGKP